MNEQEVFAYLGQNPEVVKSENFTELRELLTEKLSMTDDKLFERFKIRQHEIIDLISIAFAGGYKNYDGHKRYQCIISLKNLLESRGVLAMDLSSVLTPVGEVLNEFEKRLRLKETN